MSRLTMTSPQGGVALTFDLDVTCEISEMRKLLKVFQKLKEYEELEEQGLLLKLPFPLGTKKLYLIDGYEIDEIDATGITFYKANENAIRPHEIVICVDYCDFYYDDFGKTVFLTKEEAEQELKRLEGAE